MNPLYPRNRALICAASPLTPFLQDYAYGSSIQDLLQKMLSDVFCERPRDPIAYMLEWLKKEQQRRAEEEEAVLQQ